MVPGFAVGDEDEPFGAVAQFGDGVVQQRRQDLAAPPLDPHIQDVVSVVGVGRATTENPRTVLK